MTVLASERPAFAANKLAASAADKVASLNTMPAKLSGMVLAVAAEMVASLKVTDGPNATPMPLRVW